MQFERTPCGHNANPNNRLSKIIPPTVSKMTRGIFLAAAGLLAPGCATVSNHTAKPVEITEKENAVDAQNAKLDLEVSAESQKFPYSPEDFQEYISRFPNEVWYALDKTMKEKKFKDPERILKFLVKYKVPLEKMDEDYLSNFLAMIALGAEGLSLSLDSLQQSFGVKPDLAQILEIANALGLDSDAIIRSTSDMMDGKKSSLEKPEYRRTYFDTARTVIDGICRPEIVAFVKKFETYVGKIGGIGMAELFQVVKSFSKGKLPEKTGMAWPKFEITQEEWEKFIETAKNARELLGEHFEPQALIISVYAHKHTHFIENLRLLKKENIHFTVGKQLSQDSLAFLGEKPLDSDFTHFTGWIVGALNTSVDPAGFSGLQSEYDELGLGSIKLTDELKQRLLNEIPKHPRICNFGLILLYLDNQEGIDRLREAHGLDFDSNDNLKDLLTVYLQYIKNPKQIDVKAMPDRVGYKRNFDIYEQEGRVEALLGIFARAHAAHEKEMADTYAKGYPDNDPLERRTRDFRDACKLITHMLKTWTDDEINPLLDLGLRANFTISVEDLKGMSSNLKGITMPLSKGKGPATLEHIVNTHEAFLGNGDMTMEELQALYNMDTKKREKYRIIAVGIRYIFQQFGIDFTSKMLAQFVQHDIFAAKLLQLFFNIKLGDGTPKADVIDRIGEVFRRFDLVSEVDSVGEFLMLSDLANKLTDTPERIGLLERLFERFGATGNERMAVLRALSIYSGGSTGEENLEKYFKLFEDEDLLKLYDAVQVAYGIRIEADVFFGGLNSPPDELLDADVISWITEQAAAYKAELKNYGDVNTFYGYYKDPVLREFLATNEAHAFFKESEARGKTYYSFALRDMANDFKNRNVLPYGNRLREDFGIDSAPSSGILESMTSVFGRGDVEEMTYLKTLERYGFLSDLDREETLANFKKLKKTFGFSIDRNGLLSFLQLNRNPRLFRRILDEDFVKFCTKFRIDNYDFPLHIETLESLLEAYDTQELSSVISRVKSKFGESIKINTVEDLDAAILMAKTPRLLDSLLQPDFAAYWKSAKQKYPHLAFADLVTVYRCHEEKVDMDELHDKTYEHFLAIVLQKQNFSLHERRSLRKYYEDEELQDKLTSEDFRKTVGALHMANNPLKSMTGDDVEVVLFFMDHPELLAGANKGDVTFSMFFDNKPEEGDGYAFRRSFLPSYLLLKQDPKVAAYVNILAEILPYAHHVSDGFVVKELTERYPDEAEFKAACREIALHMSGTEKNIRLNDLILAFQDDEVNYNREELTAEASGAFSDDLHRTGSDYFSYSSYNDLSQLNIFELNKVVRLRRALAKDQELRQNIGDGIRRDIEKEIVTELGGLVHFDSGFNVSFNYIPPAAEGSNGAYKASQYVRDTVAGSGMSFHQHATTWNDAKYASPSGSMFKKGGDISNAQHTAADGAVVTSLSEGKFAVHFYTNRGDVVYVGQFKYPVPQKPSLCRFPDLPSPGEVANCVIETVKDVLHIGNQQAKQ